jgi:hypothetical protein
LECAYISPEAINLTMRILVDILQPLSSSL